MAERELFKKEVDEGEERADADMENDEDRFRREEVERKEQCE